MSIKKMRPVLLATTFALAGCGGGGGSYVSSTPPAPVTPTPTPTPTPAPTPTPTPTPTSYSAVLVFPNVTSSTQFATLGYEAKQETKGQTLTGGGFSVRYDAAANNYVFDLPAPEPGVFMSENTPDRYQAGKLTDPANPGQLQPMYMQVMRPGPADTLLPGFQYTTWGYYTTNQSIGYFAFGLPTPGSGVPLTGNAAYTAYALGQDAYFDPVDGIAKLQFNFGAGTLSGTFEAWDAEYDRGVFPLGNFTFTNTVVGAGSNLGQFSGDLTSSAGFQPGSFNGLLTGPNAEELMARWSFPAQYSTGAGITYFGIWVGKKD